MTPAEFKSARKSLGLSITALAEVLDINERTIRRWEHGSVPISRITEYAMRHLLSRDRDPTVLEEILDTALRRHHGNAHAAVNSMWVQARLIEHMQPPRVQK